ncbi:UNVERIFIED_CONTAM: hypothetical protein GTU68_005965 [Idotea baltica]|nr:hypothetical protein [Idotea baltica]
MSILEAIGFFEAYSLKHELDEVGSPIVRQILKRLALLNEMELQYLTLDRKVQHLSAGELQRVRFARQLGNPLSGLLYIFDEPCRHLHPKQVDLVIKTLKSICASGNTVFVVEHDIRVIQAADYLVEVGPGAGELGGEILQAGPAKQVLQVKDSLNGAFLRGEASVYRPEARRAMDTSGLLRLTAFGAEGEAPSEYKFPLDALSVITGPSGSGKSTLLREGILESSERLLRKEPSADNYIVEFDRGIESVKLIDQSPLGQNARSTPATATGVFDGVRKLFAALPEAKARGYGQGRFSFNSKDGRCALCKGYGYLTVEMHFLPDVEAQCSACLGSRYGDDTLEVRFKGYSIADVLNMSVDSALQVFLSVPEIAIRLKTLKEVGLGYLLLGQPAASLSGGEAQRVKLSAELAKQYKGRTLYLLDTPSGGLHSKDIDLLMQLLHSLVEKGNTVLLIENTPSILMSADWCIEIDVDASSEGRSRIVATGSPEDLIGNSESLIRQYL